MVAPDKLIRGIVIDKELKAEIERRYNGWDDLRKQLDGWIAANSPNGWIDNLRQQLAAAVVTNDAEYCPELTELSRTRDYQRRMTPRT